MATSQVANSSLKVLLAGMVVEAKIRTLWVANRRVNQGQESKSKNDGRRVILVIFSRSCELDAVVRDTVISVVTSVSTAPIVRWRARLRSNRDDETENTMSCQRSIAACFKLSCIKRID